MDTLATELPLDGWPYDSRQLHLYIMVVAVVDQWGAFVGLVDAVDDKAFDCHARPTIADGDVIGCFAVAVVDLERRPALGEVRREMEPIHFQVQPQKRLCN